jgi:hypothetical protein
MIFIDRRGNIVHVKTGAGDPRQFREQIKSIMAEK